MSADVRAVIGQRAIDALQGERILLAGATGRNGREVLAQLRELGLPVRAMSRDVQAARRAHGTEGEWVEADVTRPDRLVAALAGIRVVISAVATARPVGANRPERVDFEGTRNLIAAARAVGVRRFVIITSSVSGKRGGLLNLLVRNVLVWKGAAESLLRESGLEYVIVGPAWINDEPGGVKRIRVIPRSEYRRGMAITRADLASVVIASAGEPLAANRAFTALNGSTPAGLDWRASFATLPAA